MDDEADLKKIMDVLNSTREEYQEFINFEDSDEEEEDDDPSSTQDYNFDKCFTLDISTLYKYNPKSSLKSEEKAVIDSCKDPDLKKLLLLNRQKNMQLIQIYKTFKDLLIESKQNILEKNDTIKQYYDAYKTQRQSSGSWKVSAPYFKDKNFYVCPPNADTVRKKNNHELSYYDLMPLKKWTKFECDKLINAVKLYYSNSLSAQIKKDIKQIVSSDTNTKEQIEELELKKTRLAQLSDRATFEIPPLGSDENINWVRISDVFIQDKHSEFECSAFWHIFLHPAINKSAWKSEENNKLLELVKKYKCQNWEQITKELDTNRTCFTVATQYFSTFHNNFKKGDFTCKEDRKLLDLVNKYRMGNIIPWVKIARFFKYRTRTQLHHRFTYFLSQVDKKRGKFSEAEDVMILLVNKTYGVNYRKCVEYLPERSISQIKARHTSNLKGLLIKGIWTVDEDQMVFDHASKNDKKSNSWTELTNLLKRSRGQIRQRYNVIKTFLETNPGSTVKDVPRRKHKFKNQEDTYCVVKRIAEHLYETSNDIPSIEEIEEVIRHYHKNTNSAISNAEFNPLTIKRQYETNEEDLLIDFFSNNYNEPVTCLTANNLKQAVDDVEILLDILKVNLEIPNNIAGVDLDYIDLAILQELNKRKSLKKNSNKICQLVPPTFDTAIAMRSLLVKYLHNENEQIVKKEILPYKKERIFGISNYSYPNALNRLRESVSEETMILLDSEKQRLLFDRNLFYKRFLSLFKWPAVMTLIAPSKNFISVSKNITGPSNPPIKRTYSKKSNSEQASKVRILEENAMQSLKLTPVVDKSVIVNLLKDNKRKLFCMDTVQCGKETKTRIKEVDLEFLTRKHEGIKESFVMEDKKTGLKHEEPSTSSVMDIDIHEEPLILDYDDFLDLKKLTGFIEKEKNENQNI